MEYHKLSYKKEPDPACPGFQYRIIFDGVTTDYAFDEAALKVSSMQDGIYPLVVCMCGVIGCGGMYVTTHIEGDDIVWERFWLRDCCGEPEANDTLENFDFNKELVVKPSLRFRLGEVRALADEIEKDLKAETEGYKNKKEWHDEKVKRYMAGDTSRL